MNNEIKELLEDLKNEDCYVNNETTLKFDEAGSLLNYITNLQIIEQQYSTILSENAELQGKVIKLKDELEKQRREYQETYKDVRIELKEKKETITNLQEENERLKETNVYCNRTDCSGRIKDSRKYDSVYQEKEDYKSKNEKAVEYNKKNIKSQTLNNILQGVDKE